MRRLDVVRLTRSDGDLENTQRRRFDREILLHYPANARESGLATARSLGLRGQQPDFFHGLRNVARVAVGSRQASLVPDRDASPSGSNSGDPDHLSNDRFARLPARVRSLQTDVRCRNTSDNDRRLFALGIDKTRPSRTIDALAAATRAVDRDSSEARPRFTPSVSLSKTSDTRGAPNGNRFEESGP